MQGPLRPSTVNVKFYEVCERSRGLHRKRNEGECVLGLPPVSSTVYVLNAIEIPPHIGYFSQK